MKPDIMIGDNNLTLDQLIDVARNRAAIGISKKAMERIQKSRRLVKTWVTEGKVIYGITTGFGALSDIIISKKDTETLQRNILMSHAAGVGEPLDEEIVRAVMLLRVADLSKGYSGIRFKTVNRLVQFLNLGISPVVPSQGSVGASGDLAPLAHLSLVLIGKGEALIKGRRISGKKALKECGLPILTLESGEGLALVNGTQMMTAIGALSLYDALRLAKTADIAAALSLEVLMGSRTEFDPRIHRVRPHPGQAQSADNMLRITKDSEIISSHKDCSRVQDAYTLRCSPQVHGATRDVIAYVRRVLEIEMNASTCNPIIFSDTREFLLGGNFHGQPVATALDFLSIGISELANISERRVERLVNPQLSGLPAFLVNDGGLNSGFMIAQYTAAALVSENKVLSHPACVDSIPTSANKEDHVSMGGISARKCRQIIRNAERVIAIELLCAAQAMDLFTNLKPGRGSLRAYQIIRRHIGHLDRDRILSEDIETMTRLIRSGEIIKAVEQGTGPLH